jgi:hypothetical protein
MRLIHKKGQNASSTYLSQVKSDFKQAAKLPRREFIKVISNQIELFINDMARRYTELKDANVDSVRIFVPKGRRKDS